MNDACTVVHYAIVFKGLKKETYQRSEKKASTNQNRNTWTLTSDFSEKSAFTR